MATKLVWAAKTDVGLKRQRNEDNFCMVPSQGLYVLADGMGGHSSGQVASTLCVKHVSQFVCEMAKQPGFQFMYPPNPKLSYEANILANAIKFANERVYIQSCKDRTMEGMGTTCTSIFNAPHGIILAWVGDSRIYRIRKGQITQMSRDHSLLNHLLDTGELKPEDVPNFKKTNVILRAIGLKENVEVDVREVKREQGDVYLMCSDGLSDLVTDQQIAQTVTNAANLDEACNILIGLALKAGGKDNVTVVTVGIEQEDGVAAQPRMSSQTSMPSAQPNGMQPYPVNGAVPHPMGAPVGTPHPMSAGPGPHPMSAGMSPAPSMRGLPPVGMPRQGGMAPMPGAASQMPVVSQAARLHSVRGYIIVEAVVPAANRSMPKPLMSRAAMPAIPGAPKPKPATEPVPEPPEVKENYDDFDDDDETCETRIQSREEILREIARAGAAIPSAAAAAPPAVSAGDANSPRLVNVGADKENAESLPSPELLLTEPPAAAQDDALAGDEALDDESGPKTSLDNEIPLELLNASDEQSASSPGTDVSRPWQTMEPSNRAVNSKASEPPSYNYSKPSVTGYVAPQGAITPPSDYDDDDDDSIEINDAVFRGPGAGYDPYHRK